MQVPVIFVGERAALVISTASLTGPSSCTHSSTDMHYALPREVHPSFAQGQPLTPSQMDNWKNLGQLDSSSVGFSTRSRMHIKHRMENLSDVKEIIIDWPFIGTENLRFSDLIAMWWIWFKSLYSIELFERYVGGGCRGTSRFLYYVGMVGRTGCMLWWY